ncbi:hypothetical protein KR074_005255, partial [Drosophila pseudoananassae]
MFGYWLTLVALAILAKASLSSAGEYSENAEVLVVQETEDFLDNPRYLNNEEIGELFDKISKEYPEIAQTYSIGNSIQGRPLNVLALSSRIPDSVNDDLLRPMVKLVANIQGDEALGRQMVLYLAQYLAAHYDSDKEVQKLLNTTDIHFLPTCNPDGFANAKVSQ